MNAINLQILRTLIAKDWRLFRVPMLALIICGISVYIIAAISIADDALESRGQTHAQVLPNYLNILFSASIGGIALTEFLACALGGVAIAGERADRTGDFIGLLPVTRGQIILGKLLASAMMLSIFVAIHLLVAVSCFTPQWIHTTRSIVPADFPWGQTAVSVAMSIGSAVCLFGVGWLFSTFLNSGPISACISIAVMAIAMTTMGLLVEKHHLEEWQPPLIAAAVGFGVGLPSLIGGAIYYLKRIAP